MNQLEEAEKVLEELKNVRPEMLNKKAKKLLDAITKVLDERAELKRITKIKDEYLDLIIDIGFNYDGLDGSIDGLKSLVDTLVAYAEMARKNDDKTIVYGYDADDNQKGKNILLEDIENHIPRID